jgi:hypothetical protein
LPRECHWRDLLAFTWDLRTASGGEGDRRAAGRPLARPPRRAASRWPRTPPRRVTRAGTEAIEAIFAFETATGPCNGVVRLVSEDGGPRAPGR